jgi:hypothetical protein
VVETVVDADARTSMLRSKHLMPKHGALYVPVFETLRIHDV